MLTLKSVNKAISEKWPGVGLAKGGDCFHFFPTTDKPHWLDNVFETSVCVYRINHLTLEGWMAEVESLYILGVYNRGQT